MFITRVHNALDYLGGLFFVLAPFIFGFVSIDPARNTFFLVGGVWLLYSALSESEYALVPIFSGPLHIGLDLFVGLMMLTAPQMFDYRDQIPANIYELHVLGAFAIFAHVMFSLVGEFWSYVHGDHGAHHA